MSLSNKVASWRQRRPPSPLDLSRSVSRAREAPEPEPASASAAEAPQASPPSNSLPLLNRSIGPMSAREDKTVRMIGSDQKTEWGVTHTALSSEREAAPVDRQGLAG